MHVEITEHPGTGNRTLRLDRSRILPALSEHDLCDIEFALAQRRAMTRRCPETRGWHTCGSGPGHGGARLCRACTATWTETAT